MMATIKWQCANFDEFSGRQIYAILQARSQVFSVEQNCIYQDMDDRDFAALHIVAWAADDKVSAYLRLLPPLTYYPEPSFGRVLTCSDFRGQGMGRRLMLKGLERAHELYPTQAIRINAQSYLLEFYQSFGFKAVSEQYMEDGIPHIEMLRPVEVA